MLMVTRNSGASPRPVCVSSVLSLPWKRQTAQDVVFWWKDTDSCGLFVQTAQHWSGWRKLFACAYHTRTIRPTFPSSHVCITLLFFFLPNLNTKVAVTTAFAEMLRVWIFCGAWFVLIFFSHFVSFIPLFLFCIVEKNASAMKFLEINWIKKTSEISWK